MEDRAITVTQLSIYIKQIFDAEEMLSFIKVVGEVSGLTIVKNIAYFTLKDENAQLSCVCFNPLKFNFKNGDKIYATGTPQYYVKGGKLNFNVSKIEQAGLGELYQKFLELKEKLQKLGYFDESRKKAIPKEIKKIGVVTSAEGAVIQDIINVRNRRNPKIDIILFPVKVQGVNADKEISSGIDFFNNYDVDALIVGRGGGSLEDLMPFNSELVANSIYNSNKPIVSAVGHETDFTICDFVSDLRAPTPSAASEILCEDIQGRKQKSKLLIKQLNNSFLKNYKNIVLYSSNVISSFVNTYSTNVINATEKTKQLTIKLNGAVNNLIKNNEYRFIVSKEKLQKLNPAEILKLGYATIKDNNNYVTSIKQVNLNDDLEISLKDGKLFAKVTAKGEKNGL